MDTSAPEWKCPSCKENVTGNLKPHFPLRGGEMQMRMKCPRCGHRHFRAATKIEVEATSQAMTQRHDKAVSKFVAPYRKLLEGNRQRSDKRKISALQRKLTNATPELVSAHAHQLTIESIISKHLNHSEHSTPVADVVNLLLELRVWVVGTSAEQRLQNLLVQIQSEEATHMHMPQMDLIRRLQKIQREAICTKVQTGTT